jgi:PKD repeat protein
MRMLRHRRLAGSIALVLVAAFLSSCALLDPSGPEARFDISPVVVYAGDTVELDAGPSSGPASFVSYAWDLGNGATSAGRVVTTSYDAPGTYLVRLTVQDANGKSDTLEEMITVYQHSGTVVFQEDFANGPESLGHWPLDPTWATAGDATVDRIAGDPGYALYIHSGNEHWHRRYTAVSIPPLRVGQRAVFACRIMTLQNQDDHTFLFSPGRLDLDSIAGSLPYYLFTGTGGGSYVREPSEHGSDVPRPISFQPDVYRWHTYAFVFGRDAYELRIDGEVVFSGSLTETFADATEWILILGEESFTERCVAYYDDVRVSIEE